MLDIFAYMRDARRAMSIPAQTEATPSRGNLIPLQKAADRLGRTTWTLKRWYRKGWLPAVISPGGQWSTYENFVDAVLASARPGQAGVIEEIARAWFASHAPAPAEAVAL